MELSEGATVADLAEMIQIPVDLLLAVASAVVDLDPVEAIYEDTADADDQAQHIPVHILCAQHIPCETVMELSEGTTVADLAEMIPIPVDRLLAVALNVVALDPVEAIYEDTAVSKVLEVKDICKEIKEMMETVSETVSQTVKEKEEKEADMKTVWEKTRNTVWEKIGKTRDELKKERSFRTLEEKKLHKAISTLWQVSARSNCLNFIEQEFPEMKCKHSLSPRKIKYNREGNSLLEDLASKCGKYNFRPRDIPSRVEVDIFVELYERGDDEKKVTGLFLVEVSRSDKLYPNPQYPRPFESPSTPKKNWSTNLLYKLIQLERGCIAARQCQMPLVKGAAVVSPSFGHVAECGREKLLDEVKNQCCKELKNLCNPDFILKLLP